MSAGLSGAARAAPARAWHSGRMPAWLLLPVLTLLLLALLLLAAGQGAYAISAQGVLAVLLQALGWPQDGVDAAMHGVLWTLRLPRVLLAVLVGALLGMAGAALQALFRNPLADPGLIGVSSGAALAVALALVFVPTWWPAWTPQRILVLQPAMAFAGGLLTTSLVYVLGRVGGVVSVAGMLLAGIALNALAMAVIGLASYVATDEQLRNLTFWNLGSLAAASWAVLAVVSAAGLLAMLGLLALAPALNVLALGEAEARHLGLPVERVKTTLVLLCALAVGAAVAFCGVIGFLGLVAPHCVRLLCGPDARLLLPGAALLGALLTLGADTLARTWVAPAELPIGVLTALLGAPFFLALLWQAQRRWRWT
jgi:iron complex transport system permease protein